MSREYLATKLSSGKAIVPARIQWWPRHSRAMGRYMSFCVPGKKPGASLKSVKELLQMGASEWEAMLPAQSLPGLMVEHSGLEMSLVEAASEFDGSRIERIGNYLFANVQEHAKLYGTTIPSFPEDTFRGLMEEHVSLFAEAVRRRMEGNGEEFGRCEERRRTNTLALAAFTAEWF